MTAESSKVLIRAELSSRIREALELRDWTQLEHWAKQWIQLDAKHPSGFKWLARASLAQQKLQRAAYAYGRVLDFDPDNSEARKFFAQFPSTLAEQPKNVVQNLKTPTHQTAANKKGEGPILNPDDRKRLADLEFKLAEGYFNARLFAQSATHYKVSFDWNPNQASALGAARAMQLSHQGHEATRFLRDQLYHYPEWADGRLLLGRILYELGHRSDAQREWQLVLEQDPKNEQALNFMRLLMSASHTNTML